MSTSYSAPWNFASCLYRNRNYAVHSGF